MASYDESLLASAPVATKAQLQQGYSADLLTEKPTPPPSTTNLNDLEAGHGRSPVHTHPPAVPSKERLQQYSNQRKQPWWRTTKGIIILVVVAVVIIAAVVGGAVGGSKKKKNNVDLNGTGVSNVTQTNPALQTQTQAAGGDSSQGAAPTSTSASPTSTNAQGAGPALDPNSGPTSTRKSESVQSAVTPPDSQVDGGNTGTTSTTDNTGAGTSNAGSGVITNNADSSDGAGSLTTKNGAAQGGDPFTLGGIFDN